MTAKLFQTIKKIQPGTRILIIKENSLNSLPGTTFWFFVLSRIEKLMQLFAGTLAALLPAHGGLPMVSKKTKMRVARPTDNLAALSRMYLDGPGFKLLGSFKDHDGFSGVIIGHEQHLFHLEFNHPRGTVAGRAPSEDHLLVFYLPVRTEWENVCCSMVSAGFTPVKSCNPYWDEAGRRFKDLHGYRVVLQNREWAN